MMRKRPTGYPFLALVSCLALASCALAGCGNKGELFLAPDKQLVGELDAVTEELREPAADNADDELPEERQKKKQKQ